MTISSPQIEALKEASEFPDPFFDACSAYSTQEIYNLLDQLGCDFPQYYAPTRVEMISTLRWYLIPHKPNPGVNNTVRRRGNPMARKVTVRFQDDSVREWPDPSSTAAIGSYSVIYGDGLVTVVDRYGLRISFPMATVKSVEEEPEPRW